MNNNQPTATERVLMTVSCVLAVLLLVSYCSDADASEPCRDFTDEQKWLLDAAYAMGKQHDWGYTLAAITWQESFWGDEVRRKNLDDGDYGSYGVTQMQISTGIWLLGWDDTEDNRATLKRLLLDCDTCSMELSLYYLMGHIERLGWRDGIARYNGSGEAAQRYSDAVVAKVRKLEQCIRWNNDSRQQSMQFSSRAGVEEPAWYSLQSGKDYRRRPSGFAEG